MKMMIGFLIIGLLIFTVIGISCWRNHNNPNSETVETLRTETAAVANTNSDSQPFETITRNNNIVVARNAPVNAERIFSATEYSRLIRANYRGMSESKVNELLGTPTSRSGPYTYSQELVQDWMGTLPRRISKGESFIYTNHTVGQSRFIIYYVKSRSDWIVREFYIEDKSIIY